MAMKMKLPKLRVFHVAVCLLSGSTLAQGVELNIKSNPPTVLSRETAASRSKQISRVSYSLWFGLDAERLDFKGRTILTFDWKPKPIELKRKIFVDLEGASIESAQLNGKPLSNLTQAERYDGHHLVLNSDELSNTANRLEIFYSHPYSADGNGLQRFIDPTDQRIYLYSNFEPYHAHRVFPCFDQPDLKATFEVTVEAPLDWEVISNTLPKESKPLSGKKNWIFPPSPLLSTYLFALHAGPYSVWKSEAEKIPLRLFARKSLAKYVDHEEWFKITQSGLDYYEIQFGYPYPFNKYDQIIVPEFNSGAMENAGAVTFSEKFIYRTRVTTDRRRTRANTILHEMAHMWFGDLVTMRWWNGLWLNESFATLMATSAVEHATPFKNSWQSFFSNVKEWAYWEDQLITTHPIDLPAPDTSAAEASFDGITYGKGAASLKQLTFYLGEDDFREGLQRYFLKFAYRNTSLADFMKTLSEASSQELASWQHAWLQTTGVNTVRSEWECQTDPKTGKLKISQFDLLQTGESRTHATQVALFQFPKNGGKKGPLHLQTVLNTTYKASKNPISEAIGKPCPDFVFPNYEDYDYVKVELDPVSLKYALNHVSQITDGLMRQMIWHELWQMVLDGKLRAQDYASASIKQLGEEKDTEILSHILHHLQIVLKFLGPELRINNQNKIENFIKNHLIQASGGSDHQLIWYQAFLEIASSTPSNQWAKNLLEGKTKLKGFLIDQERRWELLALLSRKGFKGIQTQLNDELLRDPTESGKKLKIAAEASIPDPILKKNWLSQITHRTLQPAPLPSFSPTPSPSPDLISTPYTLSQLKEAMIHYQHLEQEEFIRASVENYFQAIPQLVLSQQAEDQTYSTWFVKYMFPSLCDADIILRTTALLNSMPDLPATIIKSLKISRQEEERCILAREKSEKEN